MTITALDSKAINNTMKMLQMLKQMMLINEQNGEAAASNNVKKVIPISYEEQAKEVAYASIEALPGWMKKRA